MPLSCATHVKRHGLSTRPPLTGLRESVDPWFENIHFTLRIAGNRLSYDAIRFYDGYTFLNWNHRVLTPAEHTRIVYNYPDITFHGDSTYTCQAPNNCFFTTDDMVAAICEFETVEHAMLDWSNGIGDHVAFSGVFRIRDDVYEIGWDS